MPTSDVGPIREAQQLSGNEGWAKEVMASFLLSTPFCQNIHMTSLGGEEKSQMSLLIYSFPASPSMDVALKRLGVYKLYILLLKYSAAHHQFLHWHHGHHMSHFDGPVTFCRGAEPPLV